MPISGWEVVTRWTELGVGQLPMPLAVTKAYIDLFGVPPSEFHLRLPNALFGITLIPVMFAIGRRLLNAWTGLAAALLAALNPFHIQLSMEAYFYASLMLGAGLMFLGALYAAESSSNRTRLSPWFPWVSGFGFFCIAYSQITGWVLAFTLIVFVVFAVWQNRKAHSRGIHDLRLVLITYGLVGAPLLFVSWGLPHIFEKLADTSQIEYGSEVAELIGDNAWTLAFRMITAMAWGQSVLRLALVLIVFILGLVVLISIITRRHIYIFIPAILLANYLLFLITRSAFGALYESRYLSGLLPLYLAVLALGLTGLNQISRLSRYKKSLFAMHVVGIGLVALALGGPAWASNQLRGKPVPYKDLVKHVDEKIGSGAPVVVDRWFEPWNELRVYPSTNAVFTFTVPNEPLQAFRANRWRETTEQFFMRNPDAAYVELSKAYQNVPDIGPWHWPRAFFTRHVRIANEPGLKLRHWGVAARGDYYDATTNRVVVELFYNTREDVLEKLSAAGVEFYAFFGPGWRYEMSGPFGFVEVQTQGIQHWRAMTDRAVVEVVNLTDQPARVGLRVRGVAVNGNKQVLGGDGHRKTFPDGRMEVWEFGPFDLAPGTTAIPLRDDLWPQNQVRLLVERIEVGRIQ